MVEAADRLHRALDRAKTGQSFTIREIVTLARYLARQEGPPTLEGEGKESLGLLS
jgi:hypothetical protein